MTKWILLLSLFVGVAEAQKGPIHDYVTPTKKVSTRDLPPFIDDLNFDELDTAIDLQLKRWSKVDLHGTIQFGDDLYSRNQLRASLLRLKKLTRDARKKSSKRSFNRAIRKEFNVYEPDLKPGDDRYGENDPAFFTGYYTPAIDASPVKTSEYKYAVYARPSESDLVSLTRREIDFQGKLEGAGYELFYAKDLYDLYLLHIEGGGKAAFKTKGKGNQDFFLSYDGTNRQRFQFIATYMKQQGMLTDDLSIRAQRAYLDAHPEHQEDVYSSCPSYIWFKKTVTPPLGNDNVPLTDNRSIATDRKLYTQKGVISFVQASRPTEDSTDDNMRWRKFSRFFLDQDTGGAIRGKARGDLYFGLGKYARLASHNLTVRGKIYFLVLKPTARKK